MDTGRYPSPTGRIHSPRQGYAWAVAACAFTTAIATPLLEYLDPVNIVMLFLLTVLVVAARFGRGPAVLAAFLSVALFDVFFVPPRFSFGVNDAQYLVTFAVMLAVALVTGHLTAGLRRQATEARSQERRTRVLYELARDLTGALSVTQVSDLVRARAREGFDLETLLLLPDRSGALNPVAVDRPPPVDRQYALFTFEQGEVVRDDLSGRGHGAAYFPLRAPMRTRGVLVFMPARRLPDPLGEPRPLLETIASLAAIAVERLHYVDVANETQLQIVSERLRSSILSALSHDLRTPLTVLVGLADSLVLTRPPLPPPAQETAGAIREQAVRLSNLVGNLLDMARLHAGRPTLRKEWQLLEEVVGASIRLLGDSLSRHRVRVALAPDIPLLEYDAVLIERVLCNLLENAAKFAPPGTDIEVTARRAGASAEVAVCDRGPGFPPHDRDALFEMFSRGAPETTTPGVGLGLAICRAIVEAHHGRIAAHDRPGGGACVSFTLPLGAPPAIEEEAEAGNPGGRT